MEGFPASIRASVFPAEAQSAKTPHPRPGDCQESGEAPFPAPRGAPATPLAAARQQPTKHLFVRTLLRANQAIHSQLGFEQGPRPPLDPQNSGPPV